MNTLVLKKTIYLPRVAARENTKGTKYAFWVLATLMIVCVAGYVTLIDKTVLNIVAHQNAETKITALTSEIGQLQNTNIALENKINQNYALTLGYQTVPNPQFISADNSSSALLSYNSSTR